MRASIPDAPSQHATIQKAARTLTLVLLLAAAGIGEAVAQDDEASFLRSFVVGEYALIGRAPGGGEAYAGTARIEENGEGLTMLRRVGGRTVSAAGRVEVPQPPGEGMVLRFEWQDEAAVAMTCLVSGDLDNQARLTCLWNRPSSPAREPGQEALFSTANWP